jgi:diguanylate cyclase (GGDEF)-like protein
MDNATLLLALAILSSICSLALFANWAGNRYVPGLLSIAIGYAVSTVGILLLTSQSVLPPILSTVLASLLVMGGRVPLLFGLAGFWHQEKSRLPLLLLGWYLVSAAGFYYFVMIEDSIQARAAVFVQHMVIFFLMGAYIVMRGLYTERRMRPNVAISTTYGAYFLVGLFIFNAVADIFFVLTRSSVALVETDSSTFFLLLNHFVTMMTIGFAVIMMTMEELSIEFKENAFFDPITTALNHRTFLEIAQRTIGAARRHGEPVSLLTIEITNYEDVSAQFSANFANRYLRHVATRTTDHRRNEDLLGRFGTTEFQLLLPGVDEEGAKAVCDRLQESLQKADFRLFDKVVTIDFVNSSVTKHKDELNLQSLMQEGELELFRLKHQSTKLSDYRTH